MSDPGPNFNKFAVGANSQGIISIALPPQRLTRDDAILLAAWLCIVAHDEEGVAVMKRITSIMTGE